MKEPDKEKIEELVKKLDRQLSWTVDDQLEARRQLKNLYEHWFRVEIK